MINDNVDLYRSPACTSIIVVQTRTTNLFFYFLGNDEFVLGKQSGRAPGLPEAATWPSWGTVAVPEISPGPTVAAAVRVHVAN